MHEGPNNNTICYTYSSPSGDAVTLITILPPELLIEIFAYCVFSEPLAPLTLREVCRWWYALVDTSPRLWQTIPLNDAYGDMFPEQQAILWTTRSQPFKYNIELNAIDPQSILPLISPFLSSIERWGSFRLKGNNRDDELLPPAFRLTQENLTHLHLCLHDNEQEEWDDDESRITFSPISPEDCFSYAMNLWIVKLPSPRLLPRLRFVHVTIAEGGQAGLHAHPKEILEFLTACPELESFFLSGFPHDGPIDRHLPIVRLPSLITLHLKSTCFVRELLSSLDTPHLQNLYLAHLNVDFQLLAQYQEYGDSEDEAQDFSQSPSSDQATGMGLRALINRCFPPIHVLEMDFCDMRTKDFRYVFDRLPYLHDFHIVASDMSDKVIDLFRPFMPSSHTTKVLRLPGLRKLKLTNCQRLSGSAIVEALSERVNWADKECPLHTLWEVSVNGCDGFRQWDRHILSTVLGSRLRP
ncbi:hypothetical protein HYPSUDRAFT_147019 [Hypholoma sublateritium FD-334 SS-4]|uniref:F-box domain-containing protein n=1 Tax=Hypholoma sublateritium (strain FD-334 SS-4) TaxID=945553 RepID=A0A0D2NCU1_HYPSF|nr:hypothetical protein HYPSUDRAFT_147019 [Hypholoma sublateritium FD-334 SS-4]